MFMSRIMCVVSAMAHMPPARVSCKALLKAM